MNDATQTANEILGAAMILIARYKKLRDALQKAGDPTDETGALKSDAELIELLRMDGKGLVTHIDALLAKHAAG